MNFELDVDKQRTNRRKYGIERADATERKQYGT
jgi:uncharacterized DUF497 family protein